MAFLQSSKAYQLNDLVESTNQMLLMAKSPPTKLHENMVMKRDVSTCVEHQSSLATHLQQFWLVHELHRAPFGTALLRQHNVLPVFGSAHRRGYGPGRGGRLCGICWKPSIDQDSSCTSSLPSGKLT